MRPLAAACLRRLLLLLVAATVAFCASAGAAEAYLIEGKGASQAYFREGRRWPGKTITYYVSAYNKAVDRAAKAWNDAHVGVTLKRVSSRSKAKVVIAYSPQVRACEGISYVGYPGRGLQGWVDLGRGCDREFMVFTAVHELGHTLGLGHEDRKCARMNSAVDFPSGRPSHCADHSRSYWLSHLLKGDDTKGARALYGG